MFACGTLLMCSKGLQHKKQNIYLDACTYKSQSPWGYGLGYGQPEESHLILLAWAGLD